MTFSNKPIMSHAEKSDGATTIESIVNEKNIGQEASRVHLK